jgi:hypothetical protein
MEKHIGMTNAKKSGYEPQNRSEPLQKKNISHYCGQSYHDSLIFQPVQRKEINTIEQDRQCTYNVTLRCVRATIIVVEKR